MPNVPNVPNVSNVSNVSNVPNVPNVINVPTASYPSYGPIFSEASYFMIREGLPKKTVGVESPQLFSENAYLVIFTANIHKSPETYIT